MARYRWTWALGVLVACTTDGTPAETPDAAPGRPGDSGEPAALAGITEAHNAVRAGVQTQPRLAPLVWDPALAATAAAWASKCIDAAPPTGLLDHNADRSRGHPYVVGENIFGSSGPATARAAVTSWADEVSLYEYATNTCSGTCGHYTQIVWRTTLKLGCALQTCPGLRFANAIVCNYGPAGNVAGQRPY